MLGTKSCVGPGGPKTWPRRNKLVGVQNLLKAMAFGDQAKQLSSGSHANPVRCSDCTSTSFAAFRKDFSVLALDRPLANQ